MLFLIDVTKSFKARARVDGAESVLLHNDSNKSSNILRHKALSAPSIHAHALKDFVTSIASGQKVSPKAFYFIHVHRTHWARYDVICSVKVIKFATF